MKRVLVVDDDAHVRGIVCHILKEEGFETKEATSGRDALQLLTKFYPDLVIMDFQMPDMNGIEACRCIREMWGETGIPPVVMLTAMSDRKSLEAASLAGADDYLLKPFKARMILEKVQKALARFEAQSKSDIKEA